MNDQLIQDMRDHFGRKLRLLVVDIADSCERVDIDLEDVLNLVISELMCEMLLAVLASRTDKEEFLQFCNNSFDAMKDHMKKRYTTLKRQRAVH